MRSVVTFGEFSLNLASLRLMRDGRPISVESLPVRFLLELLRARGKVVTHDQLCEAIWPDRTVAFNHSIHTAIKQLRRALNDSARDPRYVGTEVGRGYRMLLPVNWPLAEFPKSKSRWRRLGLGLTMSVAGGVLILVVPAVSIRDAPGQTPSIVTYREPIVTVRAREVPPKSKSAQVAPSFRRTAKSMPKRAAVSRSNLPSFQATAADREVTSGWEAQRARWEADREKWNESRLSWAAERPSDRSDNSSSIAQSRF